jgi:hypothetical protein
VKNKCYKLHKISLHCKYPRFHVPASSITLKYVKKVLSNGSFLDKKYIRLNALMSYKTTHVHVTEEGNNKEKIISL